MTGFRTYHRLVRRSGVLVFVVLSLNAVLVGRSSGAESPGEFTAVAAASGGRIEYTIPGFTVEQAVDGGAPLSQAYLDSQAGSVSFASFPYPGENALAVPGLLSASTGQPPPPAYPFYVRASNPLTPEQEMQDPSGTYRLVARAADREAAGVAQLRGQTGEGQSAGSGGSSAVTSVRVHGEAVTATADTVNEALNIGEGALRVASVRSRSVTTHRLGSKESATETSLIVEGGSAGGYSFAFGPQGLIVAKQAVPIAPTDGLELLNGALKPAGISIAFGEERLADGGAAKTFEVRLQQDATAPFPASVVTLRLGGAASTISSSAGEALPELLQPPTGLEVDSPPVVSGSADPDLGTASSADSFDTPPTPASQSPISPSPGSSGAERSSSGGAQGSGPLPDQGVAAGLVANQPSLAPRALKSQEFIYGVILGGGILLMAVSKLWRGKGGLSI